MVIVAPPIVSVSAIMSLSIITRILSPIATGEFNAWLTELHDALLLATDALDAHRLDDVIHHLRTVRGVQFKINDALRDAYAAA